LKNHQFVHKEEIVHGCYVLKQPPLPLRRITTGIGNDQEDIYCV